MSRKKLDRTVFIQNIATGEKIFEKQQKIQNVDIIFSWQDESVVLGSDWLPAFCLPIGRDAPVNQTLTLDSSPGASNLRSWLSLPSQPSRWNTLPTSFFWLEKIFLEIIF